MGLIAKLKAKAMAGIHGACPVCGGMGGSHCKVCGDLDEKYPPGHPYRRRVLERRLRKHYGRKT